MISDVHANKREQSQLSVINQIRNFSGFYVLLITAHVVIVFPQKSYRHPALRESALAFTVYGASAILVAKVRKIFEIKTLYHENIHYLIESFS